MHAEWITLHDSLGYRRFVDFLRAESDPVGPAQPELCRDFFRRLYPSNSLSSKPPIPTGLDTILPAAYTINQSQRTPLRSMTSNDRQRARVAQENDHAARLSMRTQADEKSVSALAIVSNGLHVRLN